MKRMKGFAAAVVLAGLFVGGYVVVSPKSEASNGTPSLTLTCQVPGYETLAVVGDKAYAVYASAGNLTRDTLYSASECGAWTKLGGPVNGKFPNQIWTVSILHTGTLIATTWPGAHGAQLWRSTDSGQTWSPVQLEDPANRGSFNPWLPGTPYIYTVLVDDSIVDDGSYAYLGTYNFSPAVDGNTNYIYRSSDDGQSWQIVNTTTTHRHIHSLQVAPNGKLYVFFGDTGPIDGIFASADHGATLQPVCTARTDQECIMVNGKFDNAGNLYYGTDIPFNTDQIMKLNASASAPTILAQVPYESFSTVRLPDGSFLVGTVYEALGEKGNDPNLHIYAIVNDTVTSVLTEPIPNNFQTWAYLSLRGVFPNGDIAIFRSGYGTIFAHPNTGTTTPTTTTTAATTTTTTTTPTTTTTTTTTTTAASTTATANLAPNPDFESDPGATYYTNGTASFSWATDQAHSGTHSLKIAATDGSMSRWMSKTTIIPVTPGKTYTATVWLKTSNGNGDLSLTFWENGTYADTDSSQSTSGGWTQVTARGTAPAGATSVRLELRYTGPGSMWADDVALSDGSSPPPTPTTATPPTPSTAPTTTSTPTTAVATTPSAQNLAPDPDFESNPGATYYTNGTASFSWATDQAHSGTHSLKIAATDTTMSRWMTQTPIPVTPGETYTATVWLKTSTGAGVLSLTFWHNGTYTDIDSSQSTSGGWTQVTARGTAPAGATSVRLELRYTGPGSMWADDVTLSQS
jgi:hypothetical protein